MRTTDRSPAARAIRRARAPRPAILAVLGIGLFLAPATASAQSDAPAWDAGPADPVRDPAIAARVRTILLDAPPRGTSTVETLARRLAELGADAIPTLARALETLTLPPPAAPPRDAAPRAPSPLMQNQVDAIVAGLRRLGRAAVLPALADSHRRAAPGRARAAILRAYGAAADRRDLESLCALLAPQDPTGDADPAESRAFQSALGDLVHRQPVVLGALPSLLRHEKSAAVREATVRGLATVASGGAIDIVSAEVRTHPEEAVGALEELARVAIVLPLPADDSVLSFLRSFLSGDDPSLFRSAACALGRLDDEECIQALVARLDHPHPDVRDPALQALRAITGANLLSSPERWRAWLQDESDWRNTAGARFLSQIESGSPAMRTDAIAALASHPLCRSELVRILDRTLAHETRDVRRIGCAALELLSPGCAEPLLQRLSHDADPLVAADARAGLERIRRRRSDAVELASLPVGGRRGMSAALRQGVDDPQGSPAGNR